MIKTILKVVIVIIFSLFLFAILGGDLDRVIKILQSYDEIIQLSTSLLLAYVTWQYAYSSQKTLEFMKYSFEKEYEEDIKFMFITIDNNDLFNGKQERSKEIKFVENDNVLRGKEDFNNNLELDYDSNFLAIRLFNSGRRLISHIKLEYVIDIFGLDEELNISRRITTIIAKTIQPNDYVTIPLIKVDQLPKIKITALSLKSFNGLGKEQIANSPQDEFIYYNSKFDDYQSCN
ncbi:hypothetical protein [Orenia marismortui]|uniref:hypothetical protein n=1 Tax=Orenia marismortui TaxID=46469 RepID=UPI00035F3EE9|nr:hypothetical protein [Orenia marismortui]